MSAIRGDVNFWMGFLPKHSSSTSVINSGREVGAWGTVELLPIAVMRDCHTR